MKNGAESVWHLRIQGAALLAVPFLVGLLVGGAAERIRVSQMRPEPPMRERGPLPPEFDRLGLTEEQRTEMIAIFERSRPLTDSILREMMPVLRSINDSIRAEIRALLTPEQVERLDEFFGRMGRPPGDFGPGWRRPFGPDSPPGGPPPRPPPGGQEGQEGQQGQQGH